MTLTAESLAMVRTAADRLRILTRPDELCLLAVSGGSDSLAMLDLLHNGAESHGRSLAVAHVDHGIDPASERVAATVAYAASARGLRFYCRRLELAAATSETRARTARRAALGAMAREAGAAAVVLAHTADDQAETVLLRVLRGSGPAGLAAMAARRGRWVRPLLAIRRVQLMEHLAARGIEALSDPANADRRHLRSWLRAEVLPVVADRMPQIVADLNRVAGQAARMRQAWNELVDELPGLATEAAEGRISVAASLLAGYRSALRQAIVAAMGRRVGVLLGTRRLVEIDRLLERNARGRSIAVGDGVQAELAAGRLTLYRSISGSDQVALRPGAAAECCGARFVIRPSLAESPARTGWATDLLPGEYRARSWRAGDRIRPLNGAGSRAVAVFFREARVAPSRRAAWPVVVNADDATIVWVPGICRSDARLPEEGTEAWRVDCAFA